MNNEHFCPKCSESYMECACADNPLNRVSLQLTKEEATLLKKHTSDRAVSRLYHSDFKLWVSIRDKLKGLV